ncbi:MAG: 16S rRNA (cytosine(1402)-N(4))-methyltransferase RsmH [Pseudomonadales bacterium]|nr:16S rRNA (cytosine(1402)-N(4))-methyltransferase RsmH [Pseudomonadales bacterium]
MVEHHTVLARQAVDALIGDSSGFYIDGTFGRGGHARLILERLSEKGRLLVIDKDPEAIAVARRDFIDDKRIIIQQGSFAEIASYANALGKVGGVQGVLLDLGVSSPQLDDAGRGFSFLKDGPLDMRMNPEQGLSARQWLAAAGEEEIANVIYKYGEERFSRRMARAIVRYRAEHEIRSTLQLAEIITDANPAWEKHKHPATRVFQAIRIHINNELGDLETALDQVLEVLAINGRMVIISFHSLEDRIVKRFIQAKVKGDDYPVSVPVMHAQLKPRLKSRGKALKVEAEEIARNSRARSAVMRVAEKIA